MKELLDSLPQATLGSVHKATFIDTCFLLDELIHHKEEELEGLCLLSFNALELMHVAHKLPDMKKLVRNFLKKHQVTIVQIPVKPGEREKEKAFVNAIDDRLLSLIPDPSDAVLAAVALKTHSAILTKDKHHLFTAVLENYLEQFHIRVFKEMKDYLVWREHTKPLS